MPTSDSESPKANMTASPAPAVMVGMEVVAKRREMVTVARRAAMFFPTLERDAAEAGCGDGNLL